MPEQLLKYSLCSNIISHNVNTRPAAVVCPGRTVKQQSWKLSATQYRHRPSPTRQQCAPLRSASPLPLAAIPGPTRPKSPRNLATPTTVALLLIGRRPRNRPLLAASALSQAPPIRLIGRPVSRMWGNFLQSFPKLSVVSEAAHAFAVPVLCSPVSIWTLPFGDSSLVKLHDSLFQLSTRLGKSHRRTPACGPT